MIFFIISVTTYVLVYFFLIVLGKDSDPNMIIGYRTRRSMKNKENWLLAQEYFSRLFKKVYLLLVIIGAGWIVYEYFIGVDFLSEGLYVAIQITISIFPFLIVMYKTENMLKKHELNNGKG